MWGSQLQQYYYCIIQKFIQKHLFAFRFLVGPLALFSVVVQSTALGSVQVLYLLLGTVVRV